MAFPSFIAHYISGTYHLFLLNWPKLLSTASITVLELQETDEK